MKLNPICARFFLVFPIASLVLSVASAQVSPTSNFELAGQLQILTSLNTLPTSKQGQSAFSIPSLRFEALKSLSRDIDFNMQIEGAEHRDSTHKEFQWNLKQAYLSYQMNEGEQDLIYGLIPNWFYTSGKELWPFQVWSTKSQLGPQRFGLIPESDLGLLWTHALGGDKEEWGIQLSNGEGQKEDENGPQKELALFTRQEVGPLVDVLAYASYAKYGNVTAEFDQKVRFILDVLYEKERIKSNLILFYASTPADVIRSQKLLDEVDVLAKSGSLLSSYGAQWALQYHWAEDSSLLLSLMGLNAAVEMSDRSMWDAFLGVHKEWSSEVDFVAGYQYQHYGNAYFLASKDQDNLLVSTRVAF